MKRLALVASGVVCLVGATVPVATAQTPEKGEGLGSFSLAANAPAVQIQIDDGGRCGRSVAGTAGCEGVVPETVSTLAKGPVGFALSSVVWPGTLGGNLGSTIIVAGGPPEASSLNSPVRAEARTGGDGKEVVNDDTPPGARMTAQATDDEVKAFAELASSQAVGVGTFGNTRSRTRTAVTGPSTAVAEATSVVSDIALGPGGLVKIGSVTSQATATTDGQAAKVVGSTVTTGTTIAGVPVEISDKGVVVAGNALPLGDAQETVNAAIAQAGLTIAVSKPVENVEKGNAQYRSGSLVFVFQPQPDQQFTAVLGGAAVEVEAEPAMSFDLDGVDVPVLDDEPALDPGFDGGTAGTPGIPGTPGSEPVALDGAAVAPDLAPAAAPVEEAPVLAEPLALARRDLPGGLPAASLVLGLAGAGLLFAGFRRLPDRLLEQAPTARCALEGAP